MIQLTKMLLVLTLVLNCFILNDALKIYTKSTNVKVTAKNNNLTTSQIIIDTNIYTVLKVADGDTITIKNKTDNSTARVRFLCIDAPEKSQEKWGPISLNRLKQLLPLNTTVKLVGSKIDMYNRTLAEVINVNGTNVNLKMMEEGMVLFYPYQTGCHEYRKMESQANASKVGVWQDKNFEKPWDYRKRAGIGYRGGAFDKHANGTYIKNNIKYSNSTSPYSTSTNPTIEIKDGKKLTTKFSYRDALVGQVSNDVQVTTNSRRDLLVEKLNRARERYSTSEQIL